MYPILYEIILISFYIYIRLDLFLFVLWVSECLKIGGQRERERKEKYLFSAMLW